MVQMPWLFPPRLVEIRHRVHRIAMNDDLIVEVSSGRTTGRSLVADDLALLDNLACGHGCAAHMAVHGLDAVPMVQHHRNAVAAVPSGLLDLAVSRRSDCRAVRSRDVDAVVILPSATAKRVGAPAIVRCDESIQGPERRSLREDAVVLGGCVLQDEKVP